jgi:hypothetical protein
LFQIFAEGRCACGHRIEEVEELAARNDIPEVPALPVTGPGA